MKPKPVKCEVKGCKFYACAMIKRMFVCKKHFYSIKRKKKPYNFASPSREMHKEYHRKKEGK